MNFFTITLIHNQAKNLPQILQAYSDQNIKPSTFVFVLDRCTDESLEIINAFNTKYNCVVIESSVDSGFMAGYCRDLGLSALGTLQSDDIVLFLDGDCVPTKNLFSSIVSETLSTEPIISIGARECQVSEESNNFTLDGREITPWLKGKVFVRGINNVVSDMCLAKIRMLLWSCCFAINGSAISKIKQINLDIDNSSRLFSESFDSIWGGEDDYVGLIAMLFDIKVIAIDPDNCVRHIWHQTRNSDAFMSSASSKYLQLVKYAEMNNAPGIINANIDPRIFEQDFFAKLQPKMMNFPRY